MSRRGDGVVKRVKGRMDESILVCVYYGPNGERLIRRGYQLADMLDCPLYVLTVDPLPYDKFDEEKSSYVDRWEELCEELDAEEFLVRDNEKRPSVKVISEVAHKFNITQIIIGQTPQNRWEEITKGSFVNALQREMTSFIDIHIVSVDRRIKSAADTTYEKGVRGFLQKDQDGYQLSFTKSKRTNTKVFSIKRSERTLITVYLNTFIAERPSKFTLRKTGLPKKSKNHQI